MVFIGKINKCDIQSGITALNPRSISKKDLTKIVEVEQDMWAREEGLGEYVRCDCCQKIFSKEDIFGHLERRLKIQTIGEIERIIGGGAHVCLNCGEKTTPIFDRNEYIEEVRDRYSNTVESFLTVYRDENGEIRGFFDGYVDSFENIYGREFKHYYSNFGIEGIRELIRQKFGIELPENLLMCSALGMEEGYKNFNILYEMMRFFFEITKLSIGDNIIGIYESSIGTNTHSIYHVAGGKGIGINNFGGVSNVKDGHLSDIFLHPRIINGFLRKMSVSPKVFLKQNMGTMKEVLKVA